ncbi:hypothetical protein HWV00_21085 (plasmid) [Moritella sp. 24]|uniref:hypothetical protein n=1 Tax=Moritella sp. 24 TaxID=2746230 RepID=UPI001BAABDEA|nr:hypothetical protein [Moritella sp. 24]QUM78770.1 hypothetical protein HWV00_21085 [Moritella sp. 24]
MARSFKMSSYEAIVVWGKVKSDLINAVGFGCDFSRVANDDIGNQIAGLSGDELELYLKDYSISLGEVLKPDYLKSLRSTMRAKRSREKKMLGENKVSSMTLDIGLKEEINLLVDHINADPDNKNRVYQVDVVRMAIADLTAKTFKVDED